MLTGLSVPTRRSCRRLAVVVGGVVIILSRNYRAGTVRPNNRTGGSACGGAGSHCRRRVGCSPTCRTSRAGFRRATLLTRINVAALAGPRDQARIPWPVVFAKAYALVAAGSPPLRRVYVKLPWPHLYELPQSVASIIVERDWQHDGDRDEKALFLGRLKAPDTATLPNLATRMLALKSAPIDSIADFRRALAIARLPLPLRLLLVWLSLNIGRQVPNFMGSFAISALGSHGAAIIDTISVWSSFLNYGPIAPDGGVDVYLSVDHRVIDGGLAARAIRALEAALNGPVLDELRALATQSPHCHSAPPCSATARSPSRQGSDRQTSSCSYAPSAATEDSDTAIRSTRRTPGGR